MTDKNESVEDAFKDFMAALGSAEAAKPFKSPFTHLPGFLFSDGKSRNLDKASHTKDPSTAGVVLKFGNGMAECDRLTSKVFTNSFEILGVPVDSDEADIKKAFKKLSLLIHPDKCSHPRAKEAFHIANKAYEELQKPEMKEKYRIVIEEAKKRVLKEISEANKLLAVEKQPLLATDNEAIQAQVTAMCDFLVREMKENAEYAEKCRRANEQWEQEQMEIIEKEEEERRMQKRRWEETRDIRAEDWRDFREDIDTKRVKSAAFVPVAHKRETRKASDKSVPSKPLGIDESYKQNWR